jgi:purine nucleosidase
MRGAFSNPKLVLAAHAQVVSEGSLAAGVQNTSDQKFCAALVYYSVFRTLSLWTMSISTVFMKRWRCRVSARGVVVIFALLILRPCFPLKAATQAATSAAAPKAPQKIIIDTDIGTDIDDAFAVALALQSHEVSVLGFSTASGDTVARAKILDEMLGASGYREIPVTVGSPTTLPFSWPPIGRQRRYGEEEHFPKTTHPVAIEFILQEIRRFPGEITLVTMGPLTNVGALIDKDAETFRQLRRVVMMGGSIGSIDIGGGGATNGPMPEYNILGDIPAAQKLFQSGVPLFVMPLDSTAQLRLDEVKRDTLFSKGTSLTDSLALLYLMWGGVTPVLFDAMTIGYIVDPTLCPVEPMHIIVDDNGVTRSEAGEPNAQVCLRSDAETFFHFYMAHFR